MTPKFGQIEIATASIKRRTKDPDPYWILFINIAGKRYQLSVSPNGKSVRFFGPDSAEYKRGAA